MERWGQYRKHKGNSEWIFCINFIPIFIHLDMRRERIYFLQVHFSTFFPPGTQFPILKKNNGGGGVGLGLILSGFGSRLNDYVKSLKSR